MGLPEAIAYMQLPQWWVWEADAQGFPKRVLLQNEWTETGAVDHRGVAQVCNTKCAGQVKHDHQAWPQVRNGICAWILFILYLICCSLTQ